MTSLDEDFRRAVEHYRSTSVYHGDAPYDAATPLAFLQQFEAYERRVLGKRGAELAGMAYDIAGQIQLPAGTRQIRAIPAHVREDINLASLAIRRDRMERNHVQTIVLLNGVRPTSGEAKLQELRTRAAAAGIEHLVSFCLCMFPQRRFMGTIRGLLNDGVLIAAARSGLADPVVISSDIDLVEVSPSYFDDIAAHFQNPCLDVLTGPVYYGYSPDGQEYAPRGLRLAAPELMLGNRVFGARRALMLMGRLGGGRLFTTEGPNSVFRASAMCAAGGYDYSLSLNEDGMMGNAIFGIRSSGPGFPYPTEQNGAYELRLWIATDPRRTLRAITEDQCIRASWRYVHFSEHDGHELELRAIAARYCERAHLLQLEDMRFSLDAPLGGKLRDRILKIFVTSQLGTEFGPGDLELYARYFGVAGWDGGETFALPDLHSAFQRV